MAIGVVNDPIRESISKIIDDSIQDSKLRESKVNELTALIREGRREYMQDKIKGWIGYVLAVIYNKDRASLEVDLAKIEVFNQRKPDGRSIYKNRFGALMAVLPIINDNYMNFSDLLEDISW